SSPFTWDGPPVATLATVVVGRSQASGSRPRSMPNPRSTRRHSSSVSIDIDSASTPSTTSMTKPSTEEPSTEEPSTEEPSTGPPHSDRRDAGAYTGTPPTSPTCSWSGPGQKSS